MRSHDHHHQDHHQDHHQHHQHHHRHTDGVPEAVELEADALRDLTDMVTEWVAALVEAPPSHVLDVGAGTGAGTFALLERFPDARVTAIDSSPQMLARLVHRADELDQSGRLAVVQADVDEGLPATDGVDLVWASSVVHHLSRPDRLLAQVAALIPREGWVVVVEAEDVAWFLPNDLGIGRPGLESRCHELLSEYRASHAPEIGSDWGARLAEAGLTVPAARVFDFEQPAPLPEAAQRYAQGWFTMLRSAARDRLDAQDLAALDVLLDTSDPTSLANRDDLTLRTTRTAWAAQRPHDRGATS